MNHQQWHWSRCGWNQARSPPNDRGHHRDIDAAYNPTFGSTPAIIENAIASGINASATAVPDKTSALTFENHSCFRAWGFNFIYFPCAWLNWDIAFSVFYPCSLPGSSTFFNTLAGLPTTTVLGATLLVTTAPAPTMASSPIVTPGKMIAPIPIQTFCPMTTSR